MLYLRFTRKNYGINLTSTKEVNLSARIIDFSSRKSMLNLISGTDQRSFAVHNVYTMCVTSNM